MTLQKLYFIHDYLVEYLTNFREHQKLSFLVSGETQPATDLIKFYLWSGIILLKPLRMASLRVLMQLMYSE